MDRTGLVLIWLLLVAFAGQPTSAQDGNRFFPLNHRTPPGTAGYWALTLGKASPTFFQPVHVKLNFPGRLTAFDHTGQQVLRGAGELKGRFLVGRVYRLRIDQIPELPGVELYPSFELIDRMHPPAHLAEVYPVPIEVTLEDVEIALQDRLVTRVVYVEQPQVAGLYTGRLDQLEETLSANANLLAEADERGRPIMILRLGGRTPDPYDPLALLRSQGQVLGFLTANQPAAKTSATQQPEALP